MLLPIVKPPIFDGHGRRACYQFIWVVEYTITSDSLLAHAGAAGFLFFAGSECANPLTSCLCGNDNAATNANFTWPETRALEPKVR